MCVILGYYMLIAYSFRSYWESLADGSGTQDRGTVPYTQARPLPVVYAGRGGVHDRFHRWLVRVAGGADAPLRGGGTAWGTLFARGAGRFGESEDTAARPR